MSEQRPASGPRVLILPVFLLAARRSLLADWGVAIVCMK